MTKVSNPAAGSALAPRHVRALKIAVGIMTALLLLGIVALVYGVARQVSKLGTAKTAAAQAPYTRLLDLGQGRLETVTTSGGLLILYWRGDGSDIVLSVDPRNGNELGRIQVTHR